MLDMLKDIIFAACNVFEEAFKDLLELLGWVYVVMVTPVLKRLKRKHENNDREVVAKILWRLWKGIS